MYVEVYNKTWVTSQNLMLENLWKFYEDNPQKAKSLVFEFHDC